jgi:hypothetical protein
MPTISAKKFLTALTEKLKLTSSLGLNHIELLKLSQNIAVFLSK